MGELPRVSSKTWLDEELYSHSPSLQSSSSSLPSSVSALKYASYSLTVAAAQAYR